VARRSGSGCRRDGGGISGVGGHDLTGGRGDREVTGERAAK
jgi:hypothetical protein